MKKKIRLYISFIVLFFTLITLSDSCVREDNIVLLPVIDIPELTTTAASEITITTAISGGNIISDKGFHISAKGICVSKTPTPTIKDSITSDGTGADPYKSIIKGLLPNTTYYVRAYARNTMGLAYGKVISFKTKNYYGTVKDIDGNIYKTVKIGNQIWMAENLKTTKYQDGSLIPNITDGKEWENLYYGAYCNYNNDVNYVKTYGRLYNWLVIYDNREIAPKGWHIPTVNEWDTLIKYLQQDGTWSVAWKLKEYGNVHWTQNSKATNETGFTALPGGARDVVDGFFESNGRSGIWWSDNRAGEYMAWTYTMSPNSSEVYKSTHFMKFGFSIRCIKDQ